MIQFPHKKGSLIDTLSNQHDVVCEIRETPDKVYVTVHSKKDWKNPQTTLFDVDTPCRICKKIGMDDPVPEGCPGLDLIIKEWC